VSQADPYLYPDSELLRNKIGIRSPALLDQIERRLVAQRVTEGIPNGRFDLQHLQAIHRHLFQDVYDWAGEIRTVELAKGGSRFQFRRFIGTGMADVHRRLLQSGFLRGLNRAQFADAAGVIMGDVNHAHPFREGNGRTQLLYLEQLAEQAGHPLDLTRLDPQTWLTASRAANAGNYAPMAEAIGRALQPA